MRLVDRRCTRGEWRSTRGDKDRGRMTNGLSTELEWVETIPRN